MSRLQRTIDKYGFTEIARENGWVGGTPNQSYPRNSYISEDGSYVTIYYSKPALKGREAFGEKSPLAPVGEVWRTGANEATTFTVSKAVKINGQALAAGTYGLFTIPGATEWTIIFNKTAKQWGAYEYKAADDVLRVKVKPTTLAMPVEQFTITADKKGKVSLMWAKTEASFMVK